MDYMAIDLLSGINKLIVNEIMTIAVLVNLDNYYIILQVRITYTYNVYTELNNLQSIILYGLQGKIKNVFKMKVNLLV